MDFEDFGLKGIKSTFDEQTDLTMNDMTAAPINKKRVFHFLNSLSSNTS